MGRKKTGRPRGRPKKTNAASHRVTVYLTDGQAAQLADLATTNNRSASAVLAGLLETTMTTATHADMDRNWIVPPECQGQVIERAYALADDDGECALRRDTAVLAATLAGAAPPRAQPRHGAGRDRGARRAARHPEPRDAARG